MWMPGAGRRWRREPAWTGPPSPSASRNEAPDRSQKDTRIAVDLKLRGTPDIFIDGRLLEDWIRSDLWKAILTAPDRRVALLGEPEEESLETRGPSRSDRGALAAR